MGRPFARFTTWLVAHPCASHAFTSSLETLGLALTGRALGVAHSAWGAALIVSAFYYGREAGQREHDLIRALPPVRAYFGAEFALRWTRDNWLEWLAAAGATSLVALALTAAGL